MEENKNKTNSEMLLEIIDGDWLSNQFGNILSLLEYEIEEEKEKKEEGDAKKPLTEEDIQSFPIHEFENLYGKGGTKNWYIEQRFSAQGKKTLDDLRDGDTTKIFEFAKKVANEFRIYLATAIEMKTDKITVLKYLAEIYNRYRRETSELRGEDNGEGKNENTSREWRK